jgi:RNA recognition motif-containing protein
MTSKVFVGNLAFKTTDQQLVEAFNEFGRVKTGVVITRGRRSLGYGFVEFESPDSAVQAVKIKNGQDFNERPIKVELATDNPVRAERPERDYSERRPKSNNSTGNTPGKTGDKSGDPEGAAPRRRRTRRRRRRVEGEENAGQPSGERKPARSSNPTTSAAGGGSTAAQAGDNPGGQLRRRRRRTNENQNNEERVLSGTSVFVANLPFGVADEELKNYFEECNPKAAHVVVTRNGRSRGYGFVEFSSEKDQKTAIDTKNGQSFTKDDVSRPITVTPSYKTQEITADQ